MKSIYRLSTAYNFKKSNRSVFVIIIACIIGVISISYLFLIQQSIRLDEAQSLWQSSHSLLGTLHTVALDVHVPLYHMILHFWIFYIGDNIVAARILSLIFFIATIPVIYLISRYILSKNWSLFVTVAFSFSPFLNWYANEARMYTVLLFLSALSQLLFLKIMRTNKGWFWYAIVSMIGVYSHYFFIFNLVAQALFFLFNRKQFKPGSLKKFITIGMLVIIAILPWLYYVYSLGSASGTRPQLPTPSTVDFFNAYSQFIFGFQTNTVNTIILSAWPLIMLIALVAVRRSNNGTSAEISFIAVMGFLPVALAYLASLVITPFFLSRYMVIAVAPLLILLGWLFSRYSKRMAISAAVLILALTALTSYLQITSFATPVKEDYKKAAEYINQNIQPQDLVVLSAPFTIYPFEYYYEGNARIATLPIWERASKGSIPSFSENNLSKEVKELNQSHRYIYLLLSQDQGYEETIRQYYLNNFKQISHHEYSPGLNLYVYQVGYYTVPDINNSQEVLDPNLN